MTDHPDDRVVITSDSPDFASIAPNRDLREQVNRHMAALDDGGFAAGDGEDYDPELLDALLNVAEAAQRAAEACTPFMSAWEFDHGVNGEALHETLMAALARVADHGRD